MVEYIEEEFLFEKELTLEKGIFDNDLPYSIPAPELLGVKIRLGNAPIVRNLKRLMELSNNQLPAEVEILFDTQDIYLITHAIGIMRLKGKAKVKELQYTAKVVSNTECRTIDLLPNTSFKTIWKLNSTFQGAVKAGGNFSATIPEELNQALSGKPISLGGDLELDLSTNTKFVGKINCSLKLPIVTSSGIATNECTWILHPDDNPLLGDQLLVQTLAVPKGTTEIIYNIKGLARIDKGFFSPAKEVETLTHSIHLNLNS
jgi:hypothetical protein